MSPIRLLRHCFAYERSEGLFEMSSGGMQNPVSFSSWAAYSLTASGSEESTSSGKPEAATFTRARVCSRPSKILVANSGQKTIWKGIRQ